MTQPPLPTLSAPPPKPQTFREWAEAWIRAKYPEKRVDKTVDEIWQEMWEDVPRRYVRDPGTLQKSDFIERARWIFRTMADPRGFLEEPGPKGKAERHLIQPMLFDLDEFTEYVVQKVALTTDDIGAVRREVEEWDEKHPGKILDLDAFMGDVRRAAGLD
jgi:hypothetical protein